MITVAVASHKGGVGKTTLTVNLGVALAAAGIPTLIVDTDTQGHVATYLGRERSEAAYRLLAASDPSNAYTGFTPAPELITCGVREGLDIIASGPRTAHAESVLAERLGRERVLARRLKEVQDDYAVCLIDVPPGFTTISSVSLYAAQGVLVPVTPGAGPENGVRDLVRRLEAMEAEVDHAPALIGLVPNMVDERERESRALLNFAGDYPTAPAIRRAVKMVEATRAGQAIGEYAPGSAVADDYTELAEWTAGKIGDL